jgi:oligoendopeptidase F
MICSLQDLTKVYKTLINKNNESFRTIKTEDGKMIKFSFYYFVLLLFYLLFINRLTHKNYLNFLICFDRRVRREAFEMMFETIKEKSNIFSR